MVTGGGLSSVDIWYSGLGIKAEILSFLRGDLKGRLRSAITVLNFEIIPPPHNHSVGIKLKV